MSTLQAAPEPESPPKAPGNPRLFDVGGDAPNVVTLAFAGKMENAPALKKGDQHTFEVTATIQDIAFVDKLDSEGFVEKTTRRQKATIDAVELKT